MRFPTGRRAVAASALLLCTLASSVSAQMTLLSDERRLYVHAWRVGGASDERQDVPKSPFEEFVAAESAYAADGFCVAQADAEQRSTIAIDLMKVYVHGLNSTFSDSSCLGASYSRVENIFQVKFRVAEDTFARISGAITLDPYAGAYYGDGVGYSLKDDAGTVVVEATASLSPTPLLDVLRLPPQDYTLRLFNVGECGGKWYQGGTIDAEVRFASACDPLDITDEPDSIRVWPSATATFAVAATGTDLVYRWYRHVDHGELQIMDDDRVSGATTPALKIKRVTSADAGRYSARVASVCDDVRSAQAILTVGCPPDCNVDGKLDINDFLCFQAKWKARDLFADYNDDGAWNINDFIAFQADFRKGCS